MSAPPVVAGVSYVLCHVPHMVRYGSKPRREGGALTLRSFDDAVVYAPNQVYIGGLEPSALWDLPGPWWRRPADGAKRFAAYGEIMPEVEFLGLLKTCDAFNLVRLRPDVARLAGERLAAHPLGLADHLEPGGPADGLPLYLDGGEPAAWVLPGHPVDAELAAPYILENLAAKASATLAVRHLLAKHEVDAEYVLGFGEEAVGDRYQRGGGNMAKAVAEAAGLREASGADVKAFCCAPVHAMVMAGALVASGVYRNVIVAAGGSLAKLGMKFQGHLRAGMPVLEDVLAGAAIWVARDDGVSPLLRLDSVGRHRVGSGGSQQAILEDLLVRPLERTGLRFTDVDLYATEMHNPEVTKPAGSGDVPARNYRLIAALAAARGEIAPDAIATFVRERGYPGFAPTQGHIASAVPLLGHARRRLMDGSAHRVALLAKGSLFLGKMTDLADGMSVVLEGR